MERVWIRCFAIWSSEVYSHLKTDLASAKDIIQERHSLLHYDSTQSDFHAMILQLDFHLFESCNVKSTQVSGLLEHFLMIAGGRILIKFEDDVTCVYAICEGVRIWEHSTKFEFSVVTFLVLRFVNWLANIISNLCLEKNEEEGVATLIAWVGDRNIKLTFCLSVVSALLYCLNLNLAIQVRYHWVWQLERVGLMWLRYDIVKWKIDTTDQLLFLQIV